MSWVSIDDQFHSNPKVVAAGLAGAGLFARAIAYCGAHLTDGHVPRNWALEAGGKKLCQTLVEENLWVETERGYFMAAYLEFNPSREQVLARREERSQAGAKGAAKRWLSGSHSYSHSSSHSSSHADSYGGSDGKQDANAGARATRESLAPTPKRKTAEQTVVQGAGAALPDESLEQLGQRLETTQNGSRAAYGTVDSVYEVIDKPAANTRRELEKWLGILPPQLVEHVREQVLACAPRKSKAAYAVGTAQKLAREQGAA